MNLPFGSGGKSDRLIPVTELLDVRDGLSNDYLTKPMTPVHRTFADVIVLAVI